MIKSEINDIKNQLLRDIGEIGITDKKIKIKVAKLISFKLKEATNDSIYQYIINQLNE